MSICLPKDEKFEYKPSRLGYGQKMLPTHAMAIVEGFPSTTCFNVLVHPSPITGGHVTSFNVLSKKFTQFLALSSTSKLFNAMALAYLMRNILSL